MSPRTLIGLGIIAAVTLSGCGGTADPPPPTGPTTTSSGTPTPSVPPPVDNPVDLTPYALHPCPVLTTQQVTDLGLPTDEIEELPKHEGDSEFMQCWWTWHNRPPELPSKPGTYILTVYPTGDPLAKAYQEANSRRADELWKFEEHTVRDLPAMARFVGEGEYDCEVVVGAGNGQGFTINARSGGVPDEGLCSRLFDTAELIVDAVRG